MKNKRIKYVWLFLMMPLVMAGLVYVGISLRFVSAYCYGTTINGNDYTGKSESYVEGELLKGLDSYQLVIRDREGNQYELTGKEINATWDLEGELRQIKKSQKCYLWIQGVKKKASYQVDIKVSFDEMRLKQKIDEFGLLEEKESIEPQDAYISFEEGEYKIIPDVPGSQVNQKKLYEGIENAIASRKKEIDLVKYGCYQMPEITAASKEIVDILKQIQFYEKTNITYDFDIAKEQLSKEQIDSFLEVTENEVFISKDRVREYILTLIDKYDTVGTERDFTTWDARKIKVSKGNYGWSMGKELETNWLTDAITNGLWAVRRPQYVTTAFQRGSTDIGNTYIEIDLNRQHMWYFEEGVLIIDTDVVTGNVSKGYATPAMVACIQYKQRDATLNGENYSTPVDYWLPIFNNIGIHDAKWRYQFGGEIYKKTGSHGCINTPHQAVKILYERVKVGTPVVLYN